MKTSKRLLSILLMLTMLLSMFTVMASADTSDDTPTTVKTIKLVVRDHGSVQVNGNSAKEGDRVKVGDVLTAVPDDGYTADWTYGVGTKPLGQNTVTVTDVMVEYECDICAVFTKSEEPSTPSTEPQTVTIVAKNVKNADGEVIWYMTESGGLQSITEDRSVTLAGLTKGKKVTLQATPKSDKFKTVWTIDGIVQNDNDYSRDITVGDKDVTVKVDIQPVAVAGHKLTTYVAPEGAGTVQANLQNLQALPEGTEIELTATPKEGYTFKEWQVNGGAMVAKPKSATTTITMGDTDATVKAVFEQTTYTMTVKKGSNGTLEYRINRNNTFGNWIPVNTTTTKIQNLLKGDMVEFQTTPKKGYKTVWKVDDYQSPTHKDNVEVAVTGDRTVEISFQKKTTGDDLTLKLDISGWSHGDVYAKKNSGTSKKVTKNNLEYTLSEDDKVKFTAYPDSGFKAVWQLEDGKKYTGDTFTVDYEDMDDDDCVLYLSFVRKSSTVEDDYPTLTFDITGKHGTVYRGTREYEDGDVISIKKNDKMTFKAKTDKGYVAVWTYKGDTYVGDEYTVKMGANDAKLYVEFMDKDDIRLTELPFRDVSKRDWYYDDVVYVYRKGYMDGMSSTRFGGELNTTRGQIVTILWRLTGEPRATKRNPFTDVSSSQYYYDAISWAYDAGVVDGFDARTFKPDQNVTREQLAAILYRYAKYMNLSTSGSAYLAKYTDADKIANWAYDAMAWANYRGLINGTSATRIDPKGYATRAQIAAILHRFAVEYGA